jgi:hypothetical protein
MYFNVFWETVNSIYVACTCIFFPNLRSTLFLLMYSDVLRLTIIPIFNEKTYEKLVRVLISGSATADYRSLVEKRWRDLIHWRMPVSVYRMERPSFT